MSSLGLVALPRDMVRLLALKLSPQDLLNFCATNKQFARVCADNSFWKIKYNEDFPQDPTAKLLHQRYQDIDYKSLYSFVADTIFIRQQGEKEMMDQYQILNNILHTENYPPFRPSFSFALIEPPWQVDVTYDLILVPHVVINLRDPNNVSIREQRIHYSKDSEGNTISHEVPLISQEIPSSLIQPKPSGRQPDDTTHSTMNLEDVPFYIQRLIERGYFYIPSFIDDEDNQQEKLDQMMEAYKNNPNYFVIYPGRF